MLGIKVLTEYQYISLYTTVYYGAPHGHEAAAKLYFFQFSKLHILDLVYPVHLRCVAAGGMV